MEPKCDRHGNEWVCSWPDEGAPLSKIVMLATNPTEEGRSAYCDMYIGWQGNDRYFHGPSDINLKSSRSQKEVCNRLATRTKGEIDGDLWARLMEQVCRVVYTEFKKGEPFVTIADIPTVGAVRYSVKGFLPSDETTAVACRGGMGKGWVCIDLSLAFATRGLFAGRYQVNSLDGLDSVLYLDWEEYTRETARRFQWLAAGRGLKEVPKNIIYRRMTRPLVEEINHVRAEAVRSKAGLVIIDSLVMASGGNIKDERAASNTMEAIRELSPATRFVVGHISKADTRNENSNVTLIGSVVYENLARSYWEMQAERYPSKTSIVCIHKKVNAGPLLDNIALKLTWDDHRYMAFLVPGEHPRRTHGGRTQRRHVPAPGGPESTRQRHEKPGL